MLKEWLRNKCTAGNFNFTVVDILFENPAFDDILNKLLVLGKQFIYKMKMEQSEPSLVGFRNVLGGVGGVGLWGAGGGVGSALPWSVTSLFASDWIKGLSK